MTLSLHVRLAWEDILLRTTSQQRPICTCAELPGCIWGKVVCGHCKHSCSSRLPPCTHQQAVQQRPVQAPPPVSRLEASDVLQDRQSLAVGPGFCISSPQTRARASASFFAANTTVAATIAATAPFATDVASTLVGHHFAVLVVPYAVLGCELAAIGGEKWRKARLQQQRAGRQGGLQQQSLVCRPGCLPLPPAGAQAAAAQSAALHDHPSALVCIGRQRGNTLISRRARRQTIG